MTPEIPTDFTAAEYQEQILRLDDRNKRHMREKHHGAFLTSCDKCVTFAATVRDLRYLEALAKGQEEKQTKLKSPDQ